MRGWTATKSLLVLVVLVLDSWSLPVLGQIGSTRLDVCDADLSSFLPVPFNNMTGLICRPIWNTFVLRYSQTEDNVMTIILSAVYTSGWVGMGFSKDGMMVGASAMVGWVNREGRARIRQYYIRGFNASEVIPDKGELQLTNIPSAVVLNGATIYLAFQLKFQNRIKQQPIILAFSTKTPAHRRLTEHDDKTTLVYDFHEDSHPKVLASSSYGSIMLMRRNHGVLAIVGWGVLLPAGAIVARHFRHHDPLWYYLHISIQFVGFIIGVAAVVAGKVLHRRIPSVQIPLHSGIGTAVLVLSILQVMAFFARPDKDAKIRRYWNWYHHWLGRLALFLASLNIMFGIQAAGSDPTWKASYGFILAVTLITSIVLEILSRMKQHEKSQDIRTNSI